MFSSTTDCWELGHFAALLSVGLNGSTSVDVECRPYPRSQCPRIGESREIGHRGIGRILTAR